MQIPHHKTIKKRKIQFLLMWCLIATRECLMYNPLITKMPVDTIVAVGSFLGGSFLVWLALMSTRHIRQSIPSAGQQTYFWGLPYLWVMMFGKSQSHRQCLGPCLWVCPSWCQAWCHSQESFLASEVTLGDLHSKEVHLEECNIKGWKLAPAYTKQAGSVTI